ncbi:MAG TPA: hypothetical protein VKU02_18190 [Gemmataceae bacterium]|nr:hypothetical protein [Gemmataceae bacterium]
MKEWRRLRNLNALLTVDQAMIFVGAFDAAKELITDRWNTTSLSHGSPPTADSTLGARLRPRLRGDVSRR